MRLQSSSSSAPVAALGAGVDSLTADQLRRIWMGDIKDWGDVGGVPGEIVRATTTEADAQAYQHFFDLVTLDPPGFEHFETWDALRAAMSVDSGIVAVVPMDWNSGPRWWPSPSTASTSLARAMRTSGRWPSSSKSSAGRKRPQRSGSDQGSPPRAHPRNHASGRDWRRAAIALFARGYPRDGRLGRRPSRPRG